MKQHAGHGAIYGMGVVGAVVYFIQSATTIQDGVVGIIQAIFWPAVIVYKALELLRV